MKTKVVRLGLCNPACLGSLACEGVLLALIIPLCDSKLYLNLNAGVNSLSPMKTYVGLGHCSVP